MFIPQFNPKLKGIAKPKPPIPEPRDFALTIPTSSPYSLNNPPPEFSGLNNYSINEKQREIIP